MKWRGILLSLIHCAYSENIRESKVLSVWCWGGCHPPKEKMEDDYDTFPKNLRGSAASQVHILSSELPCQHYFLLVCVWTPSLLKPELSNNVFGWKVSDWLLFTVTALKMARGVASISWWSLFLLTVLFSQVLWQSFLITGSSSNVPRVICLSTGRSQLLLTFIARWSFTSFLFWCCH